MSRWFRWASRTLLFGRSVASALTSTLTNSSFAGAADETPRTLTYTARDASGNLLGAGKTVAFAVDTTALVSASLSTVELSTSTIADDGVESATIATLLRDTDADPVVGWAAASNVFAATGTGNTLTQPAAVSTISGAQSGSIVSTVAATKVISSTVGGMAITDTASLVVDGTGGTEIEPGSGDVVVYDDDFDTYSTVAARHAQLASLQAGPSGWYFFDPTQDTHLLSDEIVAPGYSGSSYAYRINFDYNPAGQRTMNGVVEYDSGETWAYCPDDATLFVEFWLRSDASPSLLEWMKGVEMFHASDRTQYSSWSPPSNSHGGWASILAQSNNRPIFVSDDVGSPATPATFQTWEDVFDGSWHRWTCVYKKNTTTGSTTDGIARLYIDGEKVIDASATGLATGWMVERTAPAVGNVGTYGSGVTADDVLENLSDDPVINIVFPGVISKYTGTGAYLDTGRIRIWYRPA